MGQTLSEPITQKETSKCENDFLKVGASSMQGWRISREMILMIFLILSFYFFKFNPIFKRYGRRSHTNFVTR